MAGNTLPFLVPCHRVVKTDGHIGEYGPGGPAAKRELLRQEGLDPDRLDELADAGIRYLGDPVELGVLLPDLPRGARRGRGGPGLAARRGGGAGGWVRALPGVPAADRVAVRVTDQVADRVAAHRHGFISIGPLRVWVPPEG